MGKRVLFLSNHFITLYNFRKELIGSLIEQGHTVYISTPKSDENTFFSDMGCRIIETPVDRRGINFIRDMGLILKYIRIIREIKPDIIFSYTIKPNIYGSIASNITKRRQINNITGTGATFLKNGVLSKIVKVLYKLSVKRSYKVFFQNSGDRDLFAESGMIRDNYALIPGSGVNTDQFAVTTLPGADTVNFIFIGRIMKVKGIDQYLQAAEAVKKEYPAVNFLIAGFIEEDEYTQIIEDYQRKGIVDFIGFKKDIKTWIEKCHCTVLPSLGGEGVPNVLLESAAMGRACIASKINGAVDALDDGVTGYLFEAGNTEDLTEKVIRFINMSFDGKVRMGLAGRSKMEREFDRRIVIKKYLNEIEILEPSTDIAADIPRQNVR